MSQESLRYRKGTRLRPAQEGRGGRCDRDMLRISMKTDTDSDPKRSLVPVKAGRGLQCRRGSVTIHDHWPLLVRAADMRRSGRCDLRFSDGYRRHCSIHNSHPSGHAPIIQASVIPFCCKPVSAAGASFGYCSEPVAYGIRCLLWSSKATSCSMVRQSGYQALRRKRAR